MVRRLNGLRNDGLLHEDGKAEVSELIELNLSMVVSQKAPTERRGDSEEDLAATGEEEAYERPFTVHCVRYNGILFMQGSLSIELNIKKKQSELWTRVTGHAKTHSGLTIPLDAVQKASYVLYSSIEVTLDGGHKIILEMDDIPQAAEFVADIYEHSPLV
ncbi:MAG: hypothetical protein Q9191_007340 [Dirinaria sp. TL-2023a]